MDAERESIMDNEVVGKNFSRCPRCLVSCGECLGISGKMISEYQDVLVSSF